jgi:large subunit ribosomal protein L16
MQLIIYKKRHKKRYKNLVSQKYSSVVKFGLVALKAITSGFLTVKQLEIMRVVITRVTNRHSKIIIRIFLSHPLTKKSLGSRMGKGVGSVKSWVFFIRRGFIILEINQITKSLAYCALRLASLRVSLKVYIIFRNI